jgi:antitoxin component YwqK of YwqJK toxin-antitoxin module
MINMGRFSIIWILILAACQQQAPPGPTADIPAIVHNALDSGFILHGDRLYHHQSLYNGSLIKTYSNGDTASYGGYVDGLKDGEHKAWFPGKQLMERRYYKREVKTGMHHGYWENGKLRFEYVFDAGEHHGPAREWYQNGQPYRVFHYNKGYEEGSQKMWWENGVIRANYVVKQGRRYGLIGLKLCANPVKTKT